jgi:hypothetical protein
VAPASRPVISLRNAGGTYSYAAFMTSNNCSLIALCTTVSKVPIPTSLCSQHVTRTAISHTLRSVFVSSTLHNQGAYTASRSDRTATSTAAA